jgi:hypothetical protein
LLTAATYALRVLIRIIGQLDPLQHSNPMLSFNAIMPISTPMTGGVVYTMYMTGISTSTATIIYMYRLVYDESYSDAARRRRRARFSTRT